MQSLQKQFHDFILTHHLVKKGEKVLLAVSGGLDSMVMANLFLKEGIDFSIAHCNYGLRGEESDADEAFVMKWADQNAINCFVKAFDIGNGSVQLEARNARYEWFNELAGEQHFHKIATAHHLNDTLETILINLTRGTGIKGISGISVKNANVIRPLLFADRMRLHDYAMDHDLSWREDSSNNKTDYDRNHLRHNVVPELLKLNPSLFKTLGATVERLTYATEIVGKEVEIIKSRYLNKVNKGFELNIGWVGRSSDLLILNELLAPFGVNYSTAKEIFEAIGKSGKSFPTGEWMITMDRDAIYIDPDKAVEENEVIIASEGTYFFNGGKVAVELCEKDSVRFGDTNAEYFDAEKLSFPFQIRFWQEGDKFQPLGMKGLKKVSDFLIDEKVPIARKKNTAVLERKEQIAWVIGMRISEKFKIRENSKEILKITLFRS